MDPITLIFAIGALIASYAIKALITPATENPKAAALGDFSFPQTEEGTPQSVVFGDVWIEDWTVLWYGNMRNSPIRTSTDKKG
ncbi:MAG: hypothetical protein P4M05_27390 [Bradyrhizobium sp.]|nr:hypothetical protein [Bradyrhizobium sp.]